MPEFLSQQELNDWKPYALSEHGISPMLRARRRMEQQDQWADWQLLGRRMAIGCVALEITQRCNLDCTYCYLSEFSEALKDIPLEEVFRRIDMIHAHYGANTDVQITGGDPTVRRRDELVAIVCYARQKGLRPSLYTNGIRATRELLAELCDAGLVDVAFHVDLTQKRKGFDTEARLNSVRADYIQRARGLPLSVFFNTTVYSGNFYEIPGLVNFFIQNSDVVRLCSFQVGADTGRGTERQRASINSETVMDAIRTGARCALNFEAVGAGHRDCNRYSYGLVVNGKVYDFFKDAELVAAVVAKTADVEFDRQNKRQTVLRMVCTLAEHPLLFLKVAHRAVEFAWQTRNDLLAARGRIGKISFFVHNFMDASQLDRKRCESCAFMVMTPSGPMSMCVHNAKRDAYLLVPSEVKRGDRSMYWNPASGQLQERTPDRIEVRLSTKTARGRAKAGASGTELVAAKIRDPMSSELSLPLLQAKL
jgi:molybdenum cofactor biosynthesis enzyme MoaA